MTPCRHSEVLEESTCRSLLATHNLGRLATTTADALPMVFPVNYVVHRDAVAFRTVEGTKLDAVRDGQAVAFEVDDVDDSTGEGWSVVARGVATEVTDPAETLAICASGLEGVGIRRRRGQVRAPPAHDAVRTPHLPRHLNRRRRDRVQSDIPSPRALPCPEVA